MTKRAAAAILWFFAGWYAVAFVAMLLGLSPFLGPVGGTIAAALVAGDPFHLIWKPRPSPRSEAAGTAAAIGVESAQTTV